MLLQVLLRRSHFSSGEVVTLRETWTTISFTLNLLDCLNSAPCHRSHEVSSRHVSASYDVTLSTVTFSYFPTRGSVHVFIPTWTHRKSHNDQLDSVQDCLIVRLCFLMSVICLLSSSSPIRTLRITASLPSSTSAPRWLWPKWPWTWKTGAASRTTSWTSLQWWVIIPSQPTNQTKETWTWHKAHWLALKWSYLNPHWFLISIN